MESNNPDSSAKGILLACPICGAGNKLASSECYRSWTLYSCGSCGIIFWHPLRHPGGEFYETSDIHRIVQKGTGDKFEWNMRNFLEHPPVSAGRLLDVGCGSGRFLDAVVRRGYEGWGIDISGKHIEAARQFYGLKNVYASTIEEFAAREDIPRFDVITAFEVLEHLDNPKIFFNSVKKLLKPGGYLVLSVPDADRFGGCKEKEEYPPNHLFHWRPEVLREFAESNGFAVEKLLRQPFIKEFFYVRIFNTGLMKMLRDRKFKEAVSSVRDGTAVIVAAEQDSFGLRVFRRLAKLKNILLLPIVWPLTLLARIFGLKYWDLYLVAQFRGEQTEGGRPVKVFSAKSLSGNPADGIDNVNTAIFKRTDPQHIIFLADAPAVFREEGSIKKMNLKRRGIGRILEKIALLRRIKPDYLFGIGIISEIPLILFKPRVTKYVIDWHTLLLKDEKHWKVRTPWFIRKFIFNSADLIVAVSEFAAASVRKYFPRKNIVAIVNGVDSDFFNSAKKDKKYLENKYRIQFGKPVAVFVGTLQPRKRPDLVMEIAGCCPDWQFVFVGKNFEPWNFGSKAGTMRNAQWIPAMPREDVAILLASVDAFIFPSLNETCAAVVVEAMSSGLPVITSASGGNGEMIKDGESGFLIPLGAGEKELFKQKLRLLQDVAVKERIGSAARMRAINEFSWENVAGRYLDVLESNIPSLTREG